MMVSPQSLLRAFALGLVVILSSQCSFAAAGVTLSCSQTTALARTLLSQFTDACQLDRSACDANSCKSECIDGGDSYSNSCSDGCAYLWNGYAVGRWTSAATAIGYLLNSQLLIIRVAFRHAFQAGAVGNFDYNYEGAFTNDAQLAQAFGGTCYFTYNGSPCFCEQRYCDEQRQTYNNYIDCTGLEGGSILDLCRGSPAITTESPLLDILFWLPIVLCQNPTTGIAPTTPAGPGPAPAPGPGPGPGPEPAPGPGPGPGPEPAPGPGSESNGFLCFSDRMMVHVKGQGETRMDQLKVGDEILAADGVSYTQVYSFGHLDRERKADFVQIHTTSGDSKEHQSPLEITADHLLYVHEVGPVPAREVKLGDWLVTSSKDPPVPVVAIQTVQRKGVYAPFTVTGDALVNGIATSNYIALPAAFQPHLTFEQQHSLQHVSYAPFRWFCSKTDCQGYNDDKTGLFYAVRFWLPLLHWLEAQPPFVRSSLFWVLLHLTRVCAVLLLVGYCFIRKRAATRETNVLFHKPSRKVRIE